MSYPEKPEGWEISDRDWELYCEDMAQMRYEYERMMEEDERMEARKGGVRVV